MTVRVLVVDDQEMVRAGFSALLAAQPDIEVVGAAADGLEAVQMVASEAPDVVLMDIRMPVLDGLAATRGIVADAEGRAEESGEDGEHAGPRVLMLTTFDLDDYVYEALRAGASGFLLKDAPADDLVAAVRVVARGDGLLAPSVTRRLIADFAAGRSTAASGRLARSLTQRENEVLVLVAQGLSNSEIAAALVVAEQTVKTHVSRIFTKLGVRDRAQAVVFAYEQGIVVTGGE
ncbi:MAG: response regulator [Nocardioidaceae bacterium]